MIEWDKTMFNDIEACGNCIKERKRTEDNSKMCVMHRKMAVAIEYILDEDVLLNAVDECGKCLKIDGQGVLFCIEHKTFVDIFKLIPTKGLDVVEENIELMKKELRGVKYAKNTKP